MSTDEHHDSQALLRPMPPVAWPSRRDALRQSFCGLGSLGLGWLLAQGTARAGGADLLQGADVGRGGDFAAPGVVRAPHQPAPAKAVIFLFMAGGPSHVDTWDPKPLLNQLHGQKRPAEFGPAKYQFINDNSRILGTKRTFRRYGEAGIEVSDLFPHLAQHVDELLVVRSCHGDMVVHSAAQYELFSGRIVPGAPSIGSWIVYGLGSESASLPAYVVMADPRGALEAGQPLYMNGFLPASYQPTMLRPGVKPVLNLQPPPHVEADERQRTFRLIAELNRQSVKPGDAELEARIRAYNLAARMQLAAPEAFDLSGETAATLAEYGVDQTPTNDYARRCLTARRLVERGVRFVTVVSGGGAAVNQWDAHSNIDTNHETRAAETDRPIAALLADLKQRGLLDSTLVIWGGEFGRSPESEGDSGRDHHNLGFSMWLAGGGVTGGRVVGATDDIGLRAVERPTHFRDIHATVLQQMGLDQHQLSFRHLGRDERLTFLVGKPII